MRIDYNLEQSGLRDITPETIADIKGKTQADHNNDNTIARNNLNSVTRLSLNNKAKLSELEKLAIKHQVDLDFIKNTPSNFDLAQTELFTNLFGTVKPLISDGFPDSEILTDTAASRSDGNFEFGLLKNPRSKPISGVERNVSLATLFGQTVHGITYGEFTNSLWIVTSDGAGKRGYLFRCSTTFIDGQLNILSYWIIDALGGSQEFWSVAESHYNGITSLFVGVSDETGGGGHSINRYQLVFDQADNLVTIIDGTESSPGVPIIKGTGEIIDGSVSSTDPALVVERIDISEPGYLRGIEVVNQYLYIVIQNITSTSGGQVIDNIGYSFIRRVTITAIGVLTGGVNTVQFKLDDVFETALDSASSPTRFDAYGIGASRVNKVQAFSGLTQDQIDSFYANNHDSKLLYVSAKNSLTGKKVIVLIDFSFADISNTGDPNYNVGFINLERVLQVVNGYSSDSTLPFISTMADKTILEVDQFAAKQRNMLAIHDLAGFDLFQGDIKYTSKVKRYFNIENFHAQLGVIISGVAANDAVAITAGPDNDFSFTTTGGSRNRNSLTNPATFASPAALFHYHSYISGDPFWVKPDFTFSITDGASAHIGGIKSLTIKGNVSSGEALYVGYGSGSVNVLAQVPFTTINAITPQIGADGFTQYQTVSSSPVPLTAGNLGSFNGSASYDPVTGKLWVATNSGFIHNVTDGGSTLNFTLGDSFAVLKLYTPTISGMTLSSGVPGDGSKIVSLSVYNNQAYVGMSVPNSVQSAPTNTIIRVFDMVQSTSSHPISTSIFCTPDIMTDMNVTSKGMFVATGKSLVSSVYNSQFYRTVFESTEVLDEFNFFKNPLVNTNNSAQLGFNITASAFMERTKSVNVFQSNTWVLPRRAMAFGLYTDATLTQNPGKLQIIDFSDIDNPQVWTEFLMANTSSKNITQIGVSGSLLYGSGQIDALAFVDDKLFVARRDSGFGTNINVIDFATNGATIINAPFHGSGNLFTGMKFGYKNAETDKTGNLAERNNPSFHYSGFVNANIKVGHQQIFDMSAALVTNKTNKSILTPFVIVGHQYLNDLSGCVDIINGATLESVIGIGPGNVIGQGSAVKVHMNPDGSAIVGYRSGLITKIDDVRLVEKDGGQYNIDFLSQSILVWNPDQTNVTRLTDMKVLHYLDVLGNHKNQIYASYGAASGSPTLATRFIFEDVASAGGSLTSSSEFLNNSETIFYQATASPGPVQAIDFLDNRVFLGINDAVNQFRMAVLKKFDVLPQTDLGFSNNWFPILGDNGFIDHYIDYDDLHYNGIKASINNFTCVPSMSLLFANTLNGSVLFKFPFVNSSNWFSTGKTISSDTNAVALSRDVFVTDGVLSEFIPRNDQRVVFTGNWSDQVPPVVIPVTSAPLFDAPVGKKQMRGQLLQGNGFPYPLSSYTNFQAFTVAPDNNFDILWDGTSITKKGYDFKTNVLMVTQDEIINNIQVIDLLDVSTTGASYKPIFASGNVAATVSLNDPNSVITFFKTQIASLENFGGNFTSITEPLDVGHIPVVQVQTLDGTPLATFQGASSTGESTDTTGPGHETDLVKSDLASTQKVLLDPNGNPVSIVIITGRKIASEDKFATAVSVRTFNFAITQRLK